MAASRTGPYPGSDIVDCHVHVLDPERFPYIAGRRYTPPPATVTELRALHSRLGIVRTVLVQPSVYGTDNRCLLAALAELGPRARGVAVVDDTHPPSLLREMHEQGVRGARLNLQVDRIDDPHALRRRVLQLSEQLVELPWVLQVHASLQGLAGVAPTLATLRRPVVIDHFGMARADQGLRQPGFAELLELLEYPDMHIKLSGPYQISRLGPSYDDVTPIAKALVRAAPTRAIWGSDWPHPSGAQRSVDADPHAIEPFRVEDDDANLCLLHTWASAETCRQVLNDTPRKLFDFTH